MNIQKHKKKNSTQNMVMNKLCNPSCTEKLVLKYFTFLALMKFSVHLINFLKLNALINLNFNE